MGDDAHDAERAARREAEDAPEAAFAPDPEQPSAAELAEDEPEGEEVDGEPVVPEDEVGEALELARGAAATLVADTHDRQEGLVAMDANDARLFLERLTEQAQREHLGKAWVYKLPGQGGEGLTVNAVNDITQQMNWSGLCSIGIRPGSLKLEQIDGDEDGEPVKMWMATIEAVDAKTGATVTGTATEPQRMKLKKATADKKRADGKQIPADDRVFDKFAATKAANKAERNAKGKFIPTVVEQHVLAMASNNPALVERIGSEAEERAKDMPPPVSGPEADTLREQIESVYTAIRALGDGQGAVALPPGRYQAALVRADVSLQGLRAMKGWLEGRRDELAAHYAKGDGDGDA